MESDDIEKINRGSEWFKCDLHIHTPLSIVATEYKGGTDDQKWENFILGLESLPPEIKVIGINDYFFIDGYKKILGDKKNGRLQKIDLILPSIEFRIKAFSGTETFKRINYHIIFSDKLKPELIESQFLCRFNGLAMLDSEYPNISWGGIITLESLKDLGQAIIDSMPDEEKNKVNKSPQEIGFNSLNYDLEKIEDLLGEKKEPNTYLKNKYLKAIGKAEWANINWNENTVLDKKKLINGVNFVFSASPDINQAEQNIKKLEEEKVNSKLLHCSDSHTIKLNQDSNFDFINTQPKDMGHCFTWVKGDPCNFETLRQCSIDYLDRVKIQERNPSSDKIDSVTIDKISYKQDGEKKFLYLNSSLNSIIGKRGGGKSILLKSINKSVNKEIEKCDEINVFNDFLVFWKDGNNDAKNIQYIRQNYLSSIVYEDGLDYKERDNFINDLLLQNDIFKNINKNINLIKVNISEIINSKINELFVLKADFNLNKKGIKNFPSLESIKEEIIKKDQEILKSKNSVITDEDNKNYRKLKEKVEILKKQIEVSKSDLEILTSLSESLNGTIIINDSQLERLSVDIYKKIKDELTKKITTIDIKTLFQDRKTEVSNLIINNNKNLKEIEQQFQKLDEKFEKNKAIKSINDSKVELEKKKKDLEEIIKDIKNKEIGINDVIKDLASLYLSYKDKIKNILNTSGIDDFSFLKFNFVLKIDNEKNEKFSNITNKQKSDVNIKWLSDSLDEKELIETISNILNETHILNKGYEPKDAVVLLLDYRYIIDFSKSIKHKEKNIDFDKMTGGEKAMALIELIFKLDKNNFPILVDQPENDIDVSGVVNDLVNFIKKNKIDRQIIIATHSPNLVLLADTENVIVAKNQTQIFAYTNGGIEDQYIQDEIIDILEGGKIALEKRNKKLNL